MLDLPESSKKRVIEVRNLNILSFEAFLKRGNSEVIVIYEYAVNLSQSLYFTVDSNPGKSKFLFIAKQKIGRLILGFESQKVRGEMLDRSLLKRWQMKNSRYKRK